MEETLVGQTFNQLEVVKYDRRHPTRGNVWIVACRVQLGPGRMCGNTRHVAESNLKSGHTKTCANCAVEAQRRHRRKLATGAYR